METKHLNRPSWDDYFMSIARIVATRSTCDRLEGGAILVKNKRIISSGYTGAPAGMDNCNEVGHLMEEGHCVRTVHAEHNAILQAATAGSSSTVGSMMYATYLPCIHCAKYIITAGIQRLVYNKVYRNAATAEYLRQAGIVVEQYQRNDHWSDRLQEIFSKDVEERNPAEGNVQLRVE